MIKKPFLRYRDLTGQPDYILAFYHYFSPLDIKAGEKVRLDHKMQVIFYSYLMERKGMLVKEGLIYYVKLKRIVRVKYTNQERRYIESVINKIRGTESGRRKERIVQPAKKCINCGFLPYCNPLRQGSLYVREI
ncbi:CRISPR-associated protein Cas4 [Sulfolobus acidocaldarius]|uniref:CRISPR-associated exonuclease Cas4 n=1 Tax=Sulfolobus acidocaldarius (strain ATCC 33909 / DSM 639 / JCM 8929 / NBRC 15157 / NCIMB 11770) TaxID=330779 RepID=Q4J7C8_SULAC|nr:CRISPR-associated protein Cas4 [Sulfolobus acidocaldarius]AAY81311.1 conserved protein [Sulfolobus acidocaldarius DSM 639]